MDDETIWRWRWRCSEPGCGQVIQGEGSRSACDRAEDDIREHRALEQHRQVRAAGERMRARYRGVLDALASE